MNVSLSLKPVSNLLIAMGSFPLTAVITVPGYVLVPWSQFLRLCRNCTDTETFKELACILRQRFSDKGYDQVEVDLGVTKKFGSGEELYVDRETSSGF